jgi:N-acetylneuraminate synthase
MPDVVDIRRHPVGQGHPAFINAEIGINHNGDLAIAKQLIDAAAEAGCDAVKFQKRTPELCVPEERREVMRETPWGLMTYMDYRHRVEFGREEYDTIDAYCRQKGILWTASCWDEPSLDFIEAYDVAFHKVASASLTDDALLRRINSTGRPVVLSTGMSTMAQIRHAVSLFDQERLIILHCTSTYPCPPEQLNLRMIETLQEAFDCPIGYSGHEVGLQTTCAAVVLGACFVERHITLDRAMWGSDQAASVEPHGFRRLVRDIRVTEAALGNGSKCVYESEVPIMNKLRRSRDHER